MSAWLLWDGQQLSHSIMQGVRRCGAQQGPAAACGVAQCHQGHTGLAPNRELGASMVHHRAGLQTLCWMMGISLEFQPSQTQKDCLHTHHMDYYKNTHLSLPKVPRADSGGHGL